MNPADRTDYTPPPMIALKDLSGAWQSLNYAAAEAVRRARLGQAIDALGELRDLAAVTDQITRFTVQTLRDQGKSWSFIGSCLGVTKQAAQQRYGHTDHWTATDTTAGQTPSMFSDA